MSRTATGRGRAHHEKSAIDGPSVTVTQTRSAIGAKPKTRGTLRALGLRGIGQSNQLLDCPDVRGMLARVPHLVAVTRSGTSPGGTP